MFLRVMYVVACTRILFLFVTAHITLYVYDTVCLSVHAVMDICIVSAFWLL